MTEITAPLAPISDNPVIAAGNAAALERKTRREARQARNAADARRALKANSAEAYRLIEKLTQMVTATDNTETPNWGHVGDQGHVVEILRQLTGEEG